jgi:hypothetical protein
MTSINCYTAFSISWHAGHNTKLGFLLKQFQNNVRVLFYSGHAPQNMTTARILSGRSPCYQGSPYRGLLRSVKNFQSFTMICRKPHVASSICLRATIFQNPEGILWTHCIFHLLVFCSVVLAAMCVYFLDIFGVVNCGGYENMD